MTLSTQITTMLSEQPQEQIEAIFRMVDNSDEIKVTGGSLSLELTFTESETENMTLGDLFVDESEETESFDESEGMFHDSESEGETVEDESDSENSEMELWSWPDEWFEGEKAPAPEAAPSKVNGEWRTPHPNETMINHGQGPYQILSVLESATRPLRSREIAARCDLTRKDVTRNIRALRDEYNAIEDDGGDWAKEYWITDEGRRQLHFARNR